MLTNGSISVVEWPAWNCSFDRHQSGADCVSRAVHDGNDEFKRCTKHVCYMLSIVGSPAIAIPEYVLNKLIRDYTYQNSVLGPATVGECNSKLSSGQVFTYMSANDANYHYFLTSRTIFATTGASVYAVPMNGYNFNDVADVASSSASTTSSSSSSSTALANSGSTSSGPSNTSSPSSTPVAVLSTGAKAGIGIGVALGALGLIGILATFLLLRRNKKKAQAGPSQPMAQPRLPPGGPGYPGTTISEFYSPKAQYELGTDYSHTPKGAGSVVGSEQAYGDTHKYPLNMNRNNPSQSLLYSPTTVETSPGGSYYSPMSAAGHSFAGRPDRLSQLHEMG
ncbi:hypothetical protein B7494_g2471 [Chlorociboria aeruginascens]|nr:hypothetical protein B7494_g2471 [Chlorociboria aeruginascens]